ncbi:MAG: hypothetical protein KBA33_03795 [Cloacibacterium sp.]|jgi:hypothetical protein|nr:hypothetical protein [Cloacibacterium sp.]
MSKRLIYIFIFFLGILANAQESPKELNKMTPEQRREMIKNMTPEQRMQLMQQMRVNKAIKDLNVSQEKQEDFKKLFHEYFESQKAIKDKFRQNFSKNDNLSEAEARKRINQGFEVAQQMLDNRKVYTEKFLKILTPQQVLQLFHAEKRMQEKFRERGEGHGGMGKKNMKASGKEI